MKLRSPYQKNEIAYTEWDETLWMEHESYINNTMYNVLHCKTKKQKTNIPSDFCVVLWNKVIPEGHTWKQWDFQY